MVGIVVNLAILLVTSVVLAVGGVVAPTIVAIVLTAATTTTLSMMDIARFSAEVRILFSIRVSLISF